MRKKSRIVSFLLAAALCLGVMAPAFAATTKFADVPATHWAAADIDYVVKKGLFSGTSTTTFSPDGKITQGQMAVVLGRYAGQDVDNSTPWYQKGMDWANENMIIHSYEPGHQLTREEFAAMMYEFAKYTGRDTTIRDEALDSYVDKGDLTWLNGGYTGMYWAVSVGLITGTDTTHLSPKNLVTRAQVAAMLARYDRGGDQAAPVPTPTPTPGPTPNPAPMQPSTTVPTHQREPKSDGYKGIMGPKPALDSTILIPESDISVSSGLLKNGKPATPENVIEAMKEIEKLYPTGTPWADPFDNPNTVYNPYGVECDRLTGPGSCRYLQSLFASKKSMFGGSVGNMYGCGGFAAMVSYMIFPNDAECREVTDMSKVRPGDIVFNIKSDGTVSHVWVATSTSHPAKLVLSDRADLWYVANADGNYNQKINWGDWTTGRTLYPEDIKVYTRYPD